MSDVLRGTAPEPFLIEADAPRYVAFMSMPVIYEDQPAVQTVLRDVTERLLREEKRMEATHPPPSHVQFNQQPSTSPALLNADADPALKQAS